MKARYGIGALAALLALPALYAVEMALARPLDLLHSHNDYVDATPCADSHVHNYLSFKLRMPAWTAAAMDAFTIRGGDGRRLASGRFEPEFYRYDGGQFNGDGQGTYRDGQGTRLKRFCGVLVCSFTVLYHYGKYGNPPLTPGEAFGFEVLSGGRVTAAFDFPPPVVRAGDGAYMPVDVWVADGRLHGAAPLPDAAVVDGAMRLTWEDADGRQEQVFLFGPGERGRLERAVAIRPPLRYAAALLYYQPDGTRESYERKRTIVYHGADGRLCRAPGLGLDGVAE